MVSARNNEEYRFYISWLAYFLYEKEDKKTVDVDIEKRKYKAGGLGIDACYHLLYCVEPFECDMENGTEYDDAYESFKKMHRESYKDETDPYCIDPLEEWINPKIWNNAVREYKESKDVIGCHADIGYRNELKQYLQGVEKQEDRYSIIDCFYQSFINESLK